MCRSISISIYTSIYTLMYTPFNRSIRVLSIHMPKQICIHDMSVPACLAHMPYIRVHTLVHAHAYTYVRTHAYTSGYAQVYVYVYTRTLSRQTTASMALMTAALTVWSLIWSEQFLYLIHGAHVWAYACRLYVDM